MRTVQLTIFLLGMLAGSSYGQYKPKYVTENVFGFTEDEIRIYETSINDIATNAKKEAIARWKKNNEFHDKFKISPYWPPAKYGAWSNPRGISALTSDPTIKKHKLIDKMEPSDCTVHLNATLREGFHSVKLEHAFKKFEDFARELNRSVYPHSTGHNGLAYIKALRYLGWKTYYWNAASTYAEAMKLQKSYGSGFHGNTFYWVVDRGFDYDFRQPQDPRGNKGMRVPVDDRKTFLGIQSYPKQLDQIDYCIGVMNIDKHVFPIVNGDVIEGHSIFDHTRRESIERAKFSPYETITPKNNIYDPKTGGRKFGPALIGNSPGLSGVIAVPPRQVLLDSPAE